NGCMWLLVLLGYLTLWAPVASAQKTAWEKYQRAGVHAYKQGLYAEAEHQITTALEEAARGPDHLEVAAFLDNLAEVYEAQGQYTRAEPFYQRALSIREKALKPTHPGIASSLDHLAGLYDAQGQYSQAEPLYQRALMLR